MSSVFIHVGQCGNQLGAAYYKVAHEGNENRSLFKSYDGKLHSVHVDGEKKVIRKITSGKSKISARQENIVTRKQGCASNWAMGYCGPRSESSNSLMDQSLDAIRKEVERCDRFSGFIQMHSIGGGTGSGVGSHLVESLRDDYPIAYILSCAVAPHKTGESPLQHYNSLLTLSWLQRYADGVILLQNDDFLCSLSKLREFQNTREPSPLSVVNLNRHIAQCLAGIFLPVDDLNPFKGVHSGNEPWEMLRSISPMPSCKFLNAQQVIRSKCSWESITKNLVHQARKYDSDRKPFCSISNLAIGRGDSSGSFLSSAPSIQKIIQSGFHNVSWNPFPVDLWRSSHQDFMRPGESSLTVCSNSSIVNEVLRLTLNKAMLMYNANAYIHWYEKYCSSFKDMLTESMEDAEKIIDNYNEAVK